MNDLTIQHHVRLKPTAEMIPRLEYTKGRLIQHPIVENGNLRYMGLDIPTHGSVPNEDRVLYARMSNDGGVWRLTYELKPSINPLPPTGQAVGIDPGIFHIITTSKGKQVKPHPDIVPIDKRIQTLENQRDSKHTHSNRYREISRRIERLEQRLSDTRLNQFNEIAHRLVEHNDVICIEDVDVETGAIHDPDYLRAGRRAKWDLLKQVIEFRCIEAGRTFVLVPRWYTSQMCGKCGWYNPKPLSERWHSCTKCGYEADRDTNAAQAILKRGLEILNGSTRTNWCPIGHPNYVPSTN